MIPPESSSAGVTTAGRWWRDHGRRYL